MYTKLFNLILFFGKTPNEWSIGMIKPKYKQKGSCDDPNNYRGITILSCFGKLFTSVINNKLVNYFDENTTIGPEQAGFRAGHSTVDHVFTLHCIIDFFLAKKKRLYCLFIDYEKAFDRVERAFFLQNFWVKRVLRDQYIQQWSSEIGLKEIYYNYRMFKNVFAPEDYLQILPLNLAYTFVHFRTLNHRLPIQRERVMNLPYENRLCTKCSSANIGDELHYVFSCPFFLLNPEETKIFHHFIVKMQMLIDFTVFFAVKRNDYW